MYHQTYEDFAIVGEGFLRSLAVVGTCTSKIFLHAKKIN
jgi:hypothetical protein